MFNSIGQLISLPSDEVYRVGDGGPDHAVVLQILIYYLWAWKAGDDLTGEKKRSMLQMRSVFTTYKISLSEEISSASSTLRVI